MSVNFKHIQALRTRVAVWPEGPLRSRYINFLEKEIDLPVFSDELCRRILPRALSDWHTLHNPATCQAMTLTAYPVGQLGWGLVYVSGHDSNRVWDLT